LVLEGVGVERLRIYVEEKLPFILLRILRVVSSNLVGRAISHRATNKIIDCMKLFYRR